LADSSSLPPLFLPKVAGLALDNTGGEHPDSQEKKCPIFRLFSRLFPNSSSVSLFWPPLPSRKYVPPHLRKKLEAEAADPPHSSASGSSGGRPFSGASGAGGGFQKNTAFERHGGGSPNGGGGGGGGGYYDRPSSFGGRSGGGSYGAGGGGGFDRRPAGPQKATARNERLERELFGEVTKGINFEAYDDIPVEVTGQDVPPPLENVTPLSFFPFFLSSSPSHFLPALIVPELWTRRASPLKHPAGLV